MSSSGTGARITKEEATDLLHKLITESTKVQAAFGSGAGVVATVAGITKLGPDGSIAVMPKDAVVGAPTLSFKLSEVVVYTYADARAMPDNGRTTPDGPTFSFALCFVLRDGSQFSLFAFREAD